VSPSLPATVIYLLTASGLDLAPTVLTGTRILFLLIEFCLLWQLWRMDKDLSQSIFDVFLAALLAATSWVQPWYLLSLLAIAPMCDAGRRKVAAVFSASALTIYLFNYVAAFHQAQIVGTKYGVLLGYPAILTLIAPLALTALVWARRKSRVVTCEGPKCIRATKSQQRWPVLDYRCFDKISQLEAGIVPDACGGRSRNDHDCQPQNRCVRAPI